MPSKFQFPEATSYWIERSATESVCNLQGVGEARPTRKRLTAIRNNCRALVSETKVFAVGNIARFGLVLCASDPRPRSDFREGPCRLFHRRAHPVPGGGSQRK